MIANNRWLGLSLVASSLLGAGAVAGRDEDRFSARLSGFQETPAVSSTGRGTFSARLSEDGTAISFRLSYSNLEGTASAAHIHFGQKGVSGGVSVFLCGGATPACPPSGTVEGEFTAADVTGPANQGIEAGEFDELLRALRSGNAYVNVHSSKFGGGEIRGQIQSDGDN